MSQLHHHIYAGTQLLSQAGVDSAEFEARLIAAHSLDVSHMHLDFLDTFTTDHLTQFYDLIEKRCQHAPLQYLIGNTAFATCTVEVGPGVFIPRPETEALYSWAVSLLLPPNPVIVDLCTGSGALAIALAKQWPHSRIIAVDDSPEALIYATRNCQGTHIELRQENVCNPMALRDLVNSVHLIVSNPPYIPDNDLLPEEIINHEPHHALFAGPDGMDVIVPLIHLASRLLVPNGYIGIEHDETQSSCITTMMTNTHYFEECEAHNDLTGRPRFVTAMRNNTDVEYF